MFCDIDGEEEDKNRSRNIVARAKKRKTKNRGEGGHLLLPPESKPVQDKDLGRQNDPSHLAVVQSNSQEVQGASPVHRRTGHVEGKASDGGVHQDPKVVSQIGTGDAQGIHAGQDENGAESKEHAAQDRLVHRGVVGLVSQGQLVKVVAQDAQRKDGECEEIASIVRVTEYTSHEVVAVFYTRTRTRWHKHLFGHAAAFGPLLYFCNVHEDTEEWWDVNQPVRATILHENC